MPAQGGKYSKNLTKAEAYKQVHKALKRWYKPTREGFEFFGQLQIAQKFGFSQENSMIGNRLAINAMLSHYIQELGRLQPELAEVLLLRFERGESAKFIAYKRTLSMDHINRQQRLGISYLAAIIWDEEMRSRERSGSKR